MSARSGRLLLAACAALALFGLAFRLGGYPLLDPDEGRNAEVSREMASSNDYLLPHLNGLPYVDKPLLYFATGALAMEALGPTAFVARLPSLLFTLGTLLLLWWFARRIFGPEAGPIAALATAASPLTLAFARTVIMDSALTFFVVGALVAFYLAIEEAAGETVRRSDGQTDGRSDGQTAGRSDRQAIGDSNAVTGNQDLIRQSEPPTVRPSDRPTVAGWWPAVAWGCIALGVLTKGPIAIALPLMVVVPYALWRRAGKILLDPVGPLVLLALVLPWVRVISQRVPDYLHYVLFTETFQRLTTPALRRTGPWWYFTPILLIGALPWSVMALGSIRRSGAPADRRMVFLALWVLVPLVFFSLSQSKRPQYVLPLVPAIGLLVAGQWTERGAKVGSIALAAIGALLLVAFPQLPSLIRNMTPEIASAIPAAALTLGIAALICAAVTFRFRGSPEAALLALCLPTALIPLAGTRLMREIAAERSASTLAHAITPVMVDATEVVGIHAYPPSLPFYLGRTTIVATDSAWELTSNYLVRTLRFWSDAPGTPLRTGNWWQEAVIQCDRPRIFVARVNEPDTWKFLAAHLPLLAETSRYMVYGPCGQASLATRSETTLPRKSPGPS